MIDVPVADRNKSARSPRMTRPGRLHNSGKMTTATQASWI
jgi:hypothetical protein